MVREGEKDLYQLAIDSSVKVSTEMEMFWKVKTVYWEYGTYMSGVMCPCVVKILFDAHPTTIWKGGAKHYALISVHLFLPKHLCLSHTYLHAQKNMHATGIHLHYIAYKQLSYLLYKYCCCIADLLLLCNISLWSKLHHNVHIPLPYESMVQHSTVWNIMVQYTVVWYSMM